MPPKKRPSSRDLSRLKVLAAGDEQPFMAYISELLASGDPLAREAALEALVDRPIPAIRPELLALYGEVDADGEKRDPGAHLRTLITKILLGFADLRDASIGMRASDTYETSMGVDGTANLRAFGLRLIAAIDRDLFPYVAAEHVNDASTFTPEPANTALQLLAAMGHELAVYQWLVTNERHEPALVEAAVELLANAPPALMSRCLTTLTRDALLAVDEPLLTKLAETIVERELHDAYPSLASIMSAKISNELYSYLALLLAATNRPPLLAIIEQQLETDIRRRPSILDALRVRTTPEQAAILKRWADPDD
jgi:hypothetical protein